MVGFLEDFSFFGFLWGMLWYGVCLGSCWEGLGCTLRWAVHAQHSIFWGGGKSHPLAHYVSQQAFGKAHGSMCHAKALLSPSYAHISPSQYRGEFPKHHLGTAGGVTASLGSEVMWRGRSFPVFTTEIFYFISFQLILWWAFPLIIFHFHLFMFQNGNLEEKMLSWNLSHRTWRTPAYVLGFEVPAWLSAHFFIAVRSITGAGWCQWVVVLSAAALLAKGKLLSCLPPCFLLKYLWGEQGQPCNWYGENDLNMSEIYSVKPEIQTLFISLC